MHESRSAQRARDGQMEGFRCPLTDGLRSLQFGGETDGESLQPWLAMKKKFRQVMVGSCAAAAFFVASMNGALKHASALAAIRSTKVTRRRESPFWQEHGGRLRIGFIGFGRLGRQVLSLLVALGSVQPDDVIVSTPQRETTEDLRPLGVTCVFDNRRVVERADIVFLCCLPCRLRDVGQDIGGHVSPSCILYSLVAAIPAARLKALSKHERLVSLAQAEVGTFQPSSEQESAVLATSQKQARGTSSVHMLLNQSGHDGITLDWSRSTTASSHPQYLSVHDADASMLVKSETCLTVESVADDDGSDERQRAPEHLLNALRSAKACHAVYPLARVLDDNPANIGYVQARDGVRWAVSLVVCMWDLLRMQFKGDRAYMVKVINASLFHCSDSSSTTNWWEDKLLGVELTDFHLFATELHTTARPHDDSNDWQTPLSLLDAQVQFPSLFKRLANDPTLARAMREKFVAVLGLPQVLQGRSALAISQSFSALPGAERSGQSRRQSHAAPHG